MILKVWEINEKEYLYEKINLIRVYHNSSALFCDKNHEPKMIFVPFLLCGVSMAGKNVALILGKEKYASIFTKFFIVGFLMFWFGFLAVGCYLSIRDKHYSMMIFLLPFWLVGIYLVRKKLLGIESKNSAQSRINFGIIISAVLMIAALVSGAIIFGLGIVESNAEMLFAGAFFIFGALTFVLAALTVKGVFDKFKIDVLGMYVGVLLVAIGIGIVALKYGQVHSFAGTSQAFGFWIIIPIMLVAADAFQIVKCIRNGRQGRGRDI